MNKEQLLTTSTQTFNAVAAVCKNADEKLFFEKPAGKWSAAENLKHLIIATNISTLAYSLPLFLVKLAGGTPNRPSKTYEELVIKYKQKLAEGGRASGRFVPKPIPTGVSKELLITKWQTATEKHLKCLLQKRTETDLDNYLVRHPLLGRITLRELCYFTIYHTQHHQHIIEERTAAKT
jgi:hypothetical protein